MKYDNSHIEVVIVHGPHTLFSDRGSNENNHPGKGDLKRKHKKPRSSLLVIDFTSSEEEKDEKVTKTPVTSNVQMLAHLESERLSQLKLDSLFDLGQDTTSSGSARLISSTSFSNSSNIMKFEDITSKSNSKEGFIFDSLAGPSLQYDSNDDDRQGSEPNKETKVVHEDYLALDSTRDRNSEEKRFDKIYFFKTFTDQNYKNFSHYVGINPDQLKSVLEAKNFSNLSIKLIKAMLDYLNIEYHTQSSKSELIHLLKDFVSFDIGEHHYLTGETLYQELLKLKKVSSQGLFNWHKSEFLTVFHLPLCVHESSVHFTLHFSRDQFISIIPKKKRDVKLLMEYFKDLNNINHLPRRELHMMTIRQTGLCDFFSKLSIRFTLSNRTVYTFDDDESSSTEQSIANKYRAILKDIKLSRLLQNVKIKGNQVQIPLTMSYCFPYKKVSLIFRVSEFSSHLDILKQLYADDSLDDYSQTPLNIMEEGYIKHHRLENQKYITPPNMYFATKIKLNDYITGKRIQHPVKGKSCTHFECIDATTVLKSKSGTVFCICGKPISLLDWTYSNDFKAILVKANLLSYEGDMAILYPNGNVEFMMTPSNPDFKKTEGFNLITNDEGGDIDIVLVPSSSET